MTVPTPPAFTDAAETWNERFRTDDYIFGTLMGAANSSGGVMGKMIDAQ